ncbi:MAG: sigma-70 family RNA polymerase sigma factor [Isosphaeraceae bacterium]
MSKLDTTPEILLQLARVGDVAARGRLLELYRAYLRLMACSLLNPTLRAKVDPSDVIQETFLKAHREFERFTGATEPELVAWLRQILVRNIIDQAKYHRRFGRDLRWQQSLEAALDRSSVAVQRALTAPLTSPSVGAERREEAVLLADALERLPADYREVFILRNLEQIPVEHVAERMGRSVNAVRKLWTRAMLELRRELGGDKP